MSNGVKSEQELAEQVVSTLTTADQLREAGLAEALALAKAAARYGGVYASHMRDEGAKVLEAITEACQVGKEAGVPVQLAHFKIDNRRLWGSSAKTLALVERFRGDCVQGNVGAGYGH
mgnify:CR=1 FL=1